MLLATLSPQEAEAAIENLCQLVRFPTVSTIAADDGSYQAAANWLVDYCRQLDVLQVSLLEDAPEDSPVVVAKWPGRNASLPILLLNSHYDVVPAPAQDWDASTPPFAGKRVNGRIYGRGTQDMKSVCIQYVEALKKIRQIAPEWQPARDIYLTFVPDEEVGGGGMAAFLDSALYQSLPGIALALDEGLASTTSTYSVFYGERVPWFVDIEATGPTGHGSRFIESTAVEQVLALCQKALEFRSGQRDLLGLDDHSNCAHAVAASKTLGDVTSLNVTTLRAGVQVGQTFAFNCVPPTAQCSLDIRITPHTDPKSIGRMLDQWCQECTTDPAHPMRWSYIGRGHDAQEHALTSTDATINPWYKVLAGTLADLGHAVEPQVFPAATDSRFLRALGIRALGFSPLRSTAEVPCEIKLHEINEYVPEATFVEGIGVYVSLLHALASQGKEMEADDFQSYVLSQERPN